MAGRIPQSFIDELLDRTDIVEVVSARIQLRKTGKNYSACCPFHEEKTPSFTVSPDKQFYYCFGCRASGNAVGFVIEHDRLEFPAAVEHLAQLAGMEIPRQETKESRFDQQRKALHGILEQANEFYQQQLQHHVGARSAMKYLKQRHLSSSIIQHFGLGFAPPGWDNLLRHLGIDETRIELLNLAGLLVDRPEENKRYDRFRHRIIFPIRDTRGRVIAFGGRVLGEDKPKYLNSPETPVFHKGRELYGLYEANQAMPDLPRLLVVEGYMDVIALAQHDITNAVATLGTAITAEHLEKVFRHTSEVVFCFDGDNAGRGAARRALETCLPAMTDGRGARFLFLPQNEDPDTLVRRLGTDEFHRLITQAMPLSDFLLQIASEGIDTASLDGKARLSRKAVPLIHRIPRGVFRELMFQELARRTGVGRDALMALLEAPEPSVGHEALPRASLPSDSAYVPPDYLSHSPPDEPPVHNESGYDTAPVVSRLWRHPQSAPASAEEPRRRVRLPLEQSLIALLLNHPQLAQRLPPGASLRAEFAALELDDLKLFADLVELLHKHPDYSLNHVLGYWHGVYGSEQGERLGAIAAIELLPTTAQRDNAQELDDCFRQLRHRATKARLLQLQEHLRQRTTAELSSEEKNELQALMKALQKPPH